jgi:hypothetical protein
MPLSHSLSIFFFIISNLSGEGKVWPMVGMFSHKIGLKTNNNNKKKNTLMKLVGTIASSYLEERSGSMYLQVQVVCGRASWTSSTILFEATPFNSESIPPSSPSKKK